MNTIHLTPCVYSTKVNYVLTDNTTSGPTLRRWRLSNLNHEISVGEMRGIKKKLANFM